MQEIQNILVDLLELQQESIVALGTLDLFEFGVGDVLGNLLLLGKREEAVALDAED